MSEHIGDVESIKPFYPQQEAKTDYSKMTFTPFSMMFHSGNDKMRE